MVLRRLLRGLSHCLNINSEDFGFWTRRNMRMYQWSSLLLGLCIIYVLRYDPIKTSQGCIARLSIKFAINTFKDASLFFLFLNTTGLGQFLKPPRWKIRGKWFFPFCHLCETLTSHPWVLELWYSFLMRTLRGYQHVLPCDLDLGVWSFLNIALLITFQQWMPDFSYFTWIFFLKIPFLLVLNPSLSH